MSRLLGSWVWMVSMGLGAAEAIVADQRLFAQESQVGKGQQESGQATEAPVVPTEPEPPLPVYPRVNMAPGYEVDPAWPQRPSGMAWGHVPGVAVDAKDQVWIFTRAEPPVQVYAADGTFLRAWGTGVVGKAHHIKIDSDGAVWLADIGLHVIRKFTPQGEVLLTLGTPGVAGNDSSHLFKPTDMAFAANGDIFVSDGYGNNRVLVFDKQGKFLRQWGSLGTGPQEFSLPHAITLDPQGRVYVADRNNMRVQIFDQQGKLLDSWANILVPWGFCHSPDGDIWVCGSSPMVWTVDPKYPTAPLGCPPKDQLVIRFSPTGRVEQLWTLPKAEDGHEMPGQLNWLHAMAIDSRGDLYLTDIIGQRAQKFIRKP
jgi:hypothetical protein